ncbi:MAG: hypothetical protein Q9212_003352, partial [Teloschistes hypoglaucus]
MPNRYSHASVLSYYESRGFISYPDKGHSSPSPSASLVSFDLDEAYDADNAATPPLTAVPPLCDASTNSTKSKASSFENVPAKPLHSASSSIVTEIYAPGTPLQSPFLGPALSTEIAPKEPKSTIDSKPPDLQLKEEPIFQDHSHPNLRYSSAQYFPALYNQPRPSKKQKTAHDDQHVCTPADPPNPMPVSTIPSNTFTRTQNSLKMVIDQHAQYDKVPFKRIQPSFSTESLAPLEFLSFDDDDDDEDEDDKHIEGSGPSSPNADVLPWEYLKDVVPWEYTENQLSEDFPSDQNPLGPAEKERERERDNGYLSFEGKPLEAPLST